MQDQIYMLQENLPSNDIHGKDLIYFWFKLLSNIIIIRKFVKKQYMYAYKHK